VRRSRVARNFLSKFEEKVTIKRELNASDDDTSEDRQDRHEMAMAYWRQIHRQYPPVRLWDIFYYDLLFKSFESRYEL
jgi:hypothetical protein